MSRGEYIRNQIKNKVSNTLSKIEENKPEDVGSFIDKFKISTTNPWKPMFDVVVLFGVGYSCIINVYLVAFPVIPSKSL